MKHSSRCNRSVTCRTSTLPLTRSSAGTSRSSARRSRRGRGRSGRRSWRRPRRRFWHWSKSSRPKSDMLPVIIIYSGFNSPEHLFILIFSFQVSKDVWELQPGESSPRTWPRDWRTSRSLPPTSGPRKTSSLPRRSRKKKPPGWWLGSRRQGTSRACPPLLGQLKPRSPPRCLNRISMTSWRRAMDKHHQHCRPPRLRNRI